MNKSSQAVAVIILPGFLFAREKNEPMRGNDFNLQIARFSARLGAICAAKTHSSAFALLFKLPARNWTG